MGEFLIQTDIVDMNPHQKVVNYYDLPSDIPGQVTEVSVTRWRSCNLTR